MIKAIFFDIDGTLLSHRYGAVPASTQAAISQLRERQIKIFAATGRHILDLARLPVHSLPFDGYVALNGQLCLDANKALLNDVPIQAHDTDRMVSAFMQMETPIMIVERNKMYINFVNSAVRTAQKAISTPIPAEGTYSGDKVYQFMIYGDRERAQSLVSQLSNCKMSGWNPHAFDVIPMRGGKVAGIRWMLEHFSLTQQEIMAFGDGENDVDMLRYAGTGVAMGNAEIFVKQQADYVTSGVDEDGIHRALRHYGIL